MLRELWRRARGGATLAIEADTDDSALMTGRLVQEGRQVRLRTHVLVNRAAFQRWYADPEIAHLLRHDQQPLGADQAKNYFDSFILPLSARGLCFAIHETATDRLIGTTALTDLTSPRRGPSHALFRIVIGEKELWGRGYGTEATYLVMREAFDTHDLDEVRLEVFRHNPRAIAAYRRVGFRVTGEHTEFIGRGRTLEVIEMTLDYDDFEDEEADVTDPGNRRPDHATPRPNRRAGEEERTHLGGRGASRQDRLARRQRRQERLTRRGPRRQRRVERRHERHARIAGRVERRRARAAIPDAVDHQSDMADSR